MRAGNDTEQEHWALTASGIWECGECHQLTTETHFYRDRMTGEMRHQRNAEQRQKDADRCGWSYDYDYGGVQRCALPHWHRKGEHNPQIHGYGGFSEKSTRFGIRPPAEIENGASA